MIKPNKNIRDLVLRLTVTVFLSVQVLILFAPTPARAVFGSPDVVAALTGKWSKDSITEGILSASLGSLVNAFSYFMRKIAYDTASYLGSGGKGQGALAFQKSPGEYFKDVALDSAASAIEEFGKPFGLNLCKPPDLKLQVFLQVGLRQLYADPEAGGGPKPDCSWNKFQEDWKNGLDNFDEKAGTFIADAFANSLSVSQTDLGIAFGAIGKIDRINANARIGANAERIEGSGYKAVTGLISGNVKTPAQFIKDQTAILSNNGQTQLTSQQIAGIYGAGMWQVIPAAGGVFLNTLVSQLMNTVMSGGLLPDSSDSGSPNTPSAAVSAFSEYAGVINNNRAAAQNAFNFLFTAVPTQQLTTYPLLEEMSDCSNPDNPGLNNCVVDPDLVQAVKLANTGQALTIREALDKDKLHKNWALVPPSHEFNSDPRKCFNSGYYCYSNIQKLRRSRILPLGFEIAALKADPDQLQNWTLEKVVNGFYDCDTSGAPSTAHPFCHLIDPNWIIRLPEPRCDAKVYGPKLLTTDNPARREECVNISTCLNEDDKGQCLGNYGYCLREKNTWRFNGSTCPEQFNTCTTYTKEQDNSRASYLSRTVDFGQCNAQSIGCRVYSTEPTIAGSWRSTAQPADIAKEIKTGKNSSIHFNDSLKNYSCSPKADGCSALFLAGTNVPSDNIAYFKKAPSTIYEACYLVNGQWPQLNADITELLARPINNLETGLCKSYAPACTQAEVGCDSYQPADKSYQPADKGDTVTGIVGKNFCASECVGYETFKQEQPISKGAFEPTIFPLHFIPDTGAQCAPQYEGCSEFTNIDEAGAGGEKLEYYSDITYCEKPIGKNEKIFYSWEGSASAGFILQTHKLRVVLDDPADRYAGQSEIGSPAYAELNDVIVTEFKSTCSEVTYKNALQNPYAPNTAPADCRALYDEAGKIFYRYLSKIVIVSPACHPLRKTDSFLFVDVQNSDISCANKGGKWTAGANSKCELCYNGGIYKDGSCVYYTTSQNGDTKSCPATANNCRAYSGKAANNVEPILNEKFEPEDNSGTALTAAKQNWTNGVIKPEALQVGQYSLEIKGDEFYAFTTSTLVKDAFYELEFWARGAGQNLSIGFVDLDNGQNPVGIFTYDPVVAAENKAPISQTWQQYRLGPIQFTGNGASRIALKFDDDDGGTASVYYLDNVRLNKILDKKFLIKNSWKKNHSGQDFATDVPLSCDANPDDSLPGSALGCRAYTNSQNQTTAITGFDNLCRSAAVGCRAFIDTHNTVSETEAVGYNLWCVAAANTNCELKINSEVLGSCAVPAGESGCFIPRTVLNPAVLAQLTAPNITKSTVIVPADTPSTTPIYLSYRPEFAPLECNQASLGCQKVALEDHVIPGSTAVSAYKFTESFVKNNPDSYEQILCADEQIGCSAFKSNNSVAYFKDPALSGAPICVYKDKTDDSSYSGWFREGVGECADNKNLCRADSDCTPDIKCLGIGTVPCYSNYLIDGGNYGLWSNKSAQYNGSVGRCAQEYNQCTELVDPLDTGSGKADSGKGKSYYVIFNQKLLQNAGACDGKVNLKQGCVLFDLTANPTKLYNAKATYSASGDFNAAIGQAYTPVKPVETGDKDSNVLLKVERDRSCSEWLGCKDKVRVTDANGKQRTICTQYKACSAFGVGSICTDWSPATNDNNVQRLTEDLYIGRNVGWYGQDYSGYSLFNKYPISSLVSLSFEKDSAAYLAHKFDLSSAGQANNCSVDGKTCGLDNNGRCYDKKCIYPISTVFGAESVITAEEIKKYLQIGSCQAFPEETSPFSDSIAKVKDVKKPTYDTNQPGETRYEIRENLSGYNKANVCQNGDCSCEYQKVTYKNGTIDFQQKNQTVYPQGICTGGDKDGRACFKSADCNETDSGDETVTSGICSTIKDIETHSGLRGFCLESDFSRPINVVKGEYACLTWFPSDTSASNFDNYNNFITAGYYPPLDGVTEVENKKSINGQYYCTEASGINLGVVNKDLYTVISSSNNLFGTHFHYNESAYKNNYSSFFNKYGDYIYDDLYNLQEQGYFAQKGAYLGSSVVLGDLFKKFKVPFLLSGKNYDTNLGPVMGEEVDSDTYRKKIYSLMQHWAWHGAMYGLGLANTLPYNENENAIFFSNPYNRMIQFNQTKHSITHPNAVVLFTSSLFFRNYLFTSHAQRSFPNGNNYDANNSLQLRLLYQYPLDDKFLNYHGKSYWADINLVQEEIKALHFGPILGPANMDRVLTIDFEKLNTNDKKVSGKKSISGKGIEYEYVYYSIFNNQKGHFVYKIKPLSGKYAGQTKYGIVALSDTGTALNSMPSGNDSLRLSDNPLDFFDEFLDERAGYNEGTNWKKFLAWLNYNFNYDSPHSLLAIMCTFSESGYKESCVYQVNYSRVGDANKHIFDNGWGDNRLEKYFGDKGEEMSSTPYLTEVAELVPRCTQFSQVYSSVPSDNGITNKAWTNRVWNKSPDYAPITRSPARTANMEPFGSTNISPLLFNTTNWKNDLRRYVFSVSDSTKGLYYACNGLTADDSSYSTGFSTYTLDWINIISGVFDFGSGIEYCGFVPVFKNKEFLFSSGTKYLNNFFKKTFSEITYLNSDWSEPNKNGHDNAGTIESSLIPPQVYSLNSVKCFSSSKQKNMSCSAGAANEITVNRQNGVNDSGEIEIISGIKNLYATVNFFAWADHNRMPIKRVMVDWGDDNITNENRYGDYKNHKPFCGGDQGVIGECVDNNQLTCVTDADCSAGGGKCVATGQNNFGNSTRACEPNYFEFVHGYSCSTADSTADHAFEFGSKEVDAKVWDALTKQGYTKDKNDFVCIFEPKVQVLDNWGWCNGTDASGKATGYYYSSAEILGGFFDQCGADQDYPWTKYKGIIVLVP